ncbi:heparinase II/III domain-containing protein [Shewanella gaetbuli]
MKRTQTFLVLFFMFMTMSCSENKVTLKEFDFDLIQTKNSQLNVAKQISPLVLELIYKGSSVHREKQRTDIYNDFYLKNETCGYNANARIDSIPSVVVFSDEYLAEIIDEGVRIGSDAFKVSSLPYNLDDYDNRTDYYKLHSWHHIKILLDGFLIYGEQEFLDKAIDSALDWYKTVVDNGEGGSFAWYDMSVGERAVLLPLLLQEAENFDYPEKKIKKLVFLIRLHQLDLIEQNKIALHSNHGIFQMLGLLYLERNYPCLSGSNEREKLAQDNLLVIFKRSFSNEGVHLEHSPDYHFAMSEVSSLILTNSLLKNKLNLELKTILSKIDRNNEFMSYPNGKTIIRGDSIYSEHRLSKGRRCKDIFFIDKFAGKFLYENKEHCTQLSFDAAYHNNQHKHLDGMTFDLFDFGKPFIIESGFYPYVYTSPWRKFITSTRAHNTVEINGSDYILSGKKEYIYGSSLKQASNDLGVINIYSEQFRVKSDVNHKRVIQYVSQDYLLVVDVLHGTKVNNFKQWFHFNPDFEAEDIHLSYFSLRDSDGNKVHVSSLSLADGIIFKDLEFVRGQDDYEPFQGFINLSEDGKSMLPRLSVNNTADGQEVILASLFSFSVLDEIQSIEKLDSDSLEITTTHNKFKFNVNGVIY